MVSTAFAVFFDRNRTVVDRAPFGGSGSLISHWANRPSSKKPGRFQTMPLCTQRVRYSATLPAYTRSVFGDRSAWRRPARWAQPSVWMV
ncbi:hypothetical protein [Streptomyces goshikiensis]|uniref:hypothetical protein n=1 Tax=Streptomyces goshikiensis TaxID=1942 RepID=UPI0036CB4ED3